MESGNVIPGVQFVQDGIHFRVKDDGDLEVTGVDANTKNVDIPRKITNGGKTYRVTSIGERAFEGHSDINYLSIPYTIKSIGEYAFIDCGSSMTVNIADIESWCEMKLGNEHSSPLSSAGKVLVYDIETTDIVIPNTVTSIGNFTFYQCRQIKSLTIPGSVSTIGSSAFEDCTGLASISLSYGNTLIGGSTFEGCTGLTEVTIPGSVNFIGINAFKNCRNLSTIVSEIEYPSSIEECVFEGLPSYSVLQVPKGTKSAYQSAGGWNQFSNIVEIGVGNVDFSVGGINYGKTSANEVEVVSADEEKKEIVIPETITNGGVTYRVTAIGERAFDGRSDINYLSIPSSITSIGEYAFIDCGSNIKVEISDLEAWCKVKLGNEHSSPLSSAKAFYSGGREIKNLVIPNGVESVSSFVFYQCRSITSLSIPGSVKSIGSSSFEDCTGLTSVNLSEGLERIGGSSFEGCFNLPEIVLPASITLIAINGFKNCTGLKKMVSLNNNPPLCNNPFYNVDKGNCVVWVPKGCVTAYMGAVGWKDYLKIQEIKGDVNGDGKVNINDVNDIVSYIMGETPPNFNVKEANMNGDDKVNVADVTLLIRLIK